MNFKNKYEAYDYCKIMLENSGNIVENLKEINFGVQFTTTIEDKNYTIRIYESKKNGVRIDFSMIRNEELKREISNIIYDNKVITKEVKEGASKEILNKKSKKENISTLNREVKVGLADVEENPIIGTDESGKGDYFGPLVIAGVYADENIKKQLRVLGVTDSKKLTDKNISKLATMIKQICKYEIIVIGNEKYNELYGKINNLNKLLAWGHARVIENLLNKIECNIVLSDQFGNPSLIENALMNKGKNIILEQRPRAEENVVVAAASIIARDEFVNIMDRMSLKYNLEFPKGASNITKAVGREFILKCGKENLNKIAKLHFKTTEEIC